MSKNCSKIFYIKFFLVKKIMSIRLVEKSLRRGKSCRIFYRSEQNWSKNIFRFEKIEVEKKFVEKLVEKISGSKKGLPNFFGRTPILCGKYLVEFGGWPNSDPEFDSPALCACRGKIVGGAFSGNPGSRDMSYTRSWKNVRQVLMQ